MHNSNNEFEEKDKDNENNQDTSQIEQIEKIGSVIPENSKHIIHCLTIIGQIEGHYVLSSQNKTTKYEHIIPVLTAIEQDRNIEGLLIILNTAGGDVEAGLAIAELIAGIDRKSTRLNSSHTS